MQFFQAKRKWLLLGISKPPKQDNFEFFGGYERFMKRLNEIYENIITYSPSSFSRKQTPWGYEKSKLYFVPRGEPKKGISSWTSRVMKQESEHYEFPRTHYDHRTEFYPRRAKIPFPK